MLFNMISILTCNRYDSCFNAVTHIYNVFPGIIKHLPSWTKYLEVKNIDWPLASVSTQFEFFQILSCFLRSSVWSHLFDKHFCRILQLCSHFLKKFIFVWESGDLEMSWHAPCLRKWGRENTPSFFTRPSSPLILKNVHPHPPSPTFRLCTPHPPEKIRFFNEPP